MDPRLKTALDLYISEYGEGQIADHLAHLIGEQCAATPETLQILTDLESLVNEQMNED